MPAPDLTSIAVSAGSRIGRAFNVVSLLPSLFLVTLTWALVASGAVTGAPDADRVSAALSHVSLGAVAAILLVAILVGYVLHPVQFALTQLLEGYWGAGPVGRAVMVRGILYHRRKIAHLRKTRVAALVRLKALSEAQLLADAGADVVVPDQVAVQQVEKALEDYPTAGRMMPTKLGNVLRRHEDLTGLAYELPGVDLIPPLAVIAPDERTSHLAESTEQLDATVSVCTVSAIGTVLVAGATLTDGWWLLLALVPYAICLIAYRGAVSVAHSYGLAMRRLVDLERFSLYEALRLPLPDNAANETELAKIVTMQLTGKPAQTNYHHPEPGPAPPL